MLARRASELHSAWTHSTKLDKAMLEQQIDELLIISDSLNRTEGRRARKIAWRDKSIGDLVRELPPVDIERAG